MIQRAVAEGRLLTVDEIGRLQPDDFVQHNESYAWAWALCVFLDQHSRYRDAFRLLGREYVDEGFHTANHRIFGPLMSDLAAEWQLFARHLCYGFDVERAAVKFVSGTPITEEAEVHQTTVSADRGWQSSGFAVLECHTYDLQTEGRTLLAQIPKPWESEPRGISIRYSEGHPIGRLLGLIISEPHPETDRRQVSDVINLGEATEFVAPINGTLYLRVNDFWNELADNSGDYAVTVGVSAADN
jgi:hypothetical protein